MIDKERWLIAQKGERKYHNRSMEDGLSVYGHGYCDQLFKYVDVDYENLGGRSILEIGPADFPALYFCDNFKGYVIEPMDSPILNALSAQKKIVVIKGLAEEVQFPFVDEIWLFNVLTHVMNSDIIIDKAKGYSNTIRFFEPINTEISIDHPLKFNIDYYISKFGNCVKYYPANHNITNFHEHECVYGIYKTHHNV